MTIIESKRIILRTWEEEDLNDLYEYASNEIVGPNAGWPVHKSIEDSKSILRHFIKSDEVFAILLKSENKVIGSIGLHRRMPDKNLAHLNQREFGFVLNPKYWGQGIMGEAINSLYDYGFNQLDLDLIWCCHFEDNNNSKRVCEKNGLKYKFTRDKVLELLGNKEVKALYYNISKEEYINRLY
ncbi:GNAT family N-acetyltransferase [Clostridium sp. B9]|uniref:GNAT family N-acetyltransferase n=1 Tax=Clostridium sp. B9 TaxID=3423224 RepID=UPI003D2EE23D